MKKVGMQYTHKLRTSQVNDTEIVKQQADKSI